MRWQQVLYWFAIFMIAVNLSGQMALHGLGAVCSSVSSLVFLCVALHQAGTIARAKQREQILTNWHKNLLRMAAAERAKQVRQFNVFDPREHFDR